MHSTVSNYWSLATGTCIFFVLSTGFFLGISLVLLYNRVNFELKALEDGHCDFDTCELKVKEEDSNQTVRCIFKLAPVCGTPQRKTIINVYYFIYIIS